MPIEFKQKVAVFDGHCEIELAEALAAWLAEKPNRQVNLKLLTSAHTAVYQVLLNLQPGVSVWPKLPDLEWLQTAMQSIGRVTEPG